MEKEEAIKYIYKQLDAACDDVDVMGDEMFVALQVLVKIAEQEPCEDAVSRQKILKRLQVEIDQESSYIQRELAKETPSGTVRDNGRLGRLQGLNWVKNVVGNLPPVQPKERVGHWIETDNYYQRWKCSECGCHTRDAEPPFCPNCRAKMKGANQ